MDTYVFPDGRKFRVLGRNILVRRVSPPERSQGGILLVDGGKGSDGTEVGIILAVGHITAKKTGVRIPLSEVEPGLTPGQMCSYLWFYSERHTNINLRARLGHDVSIIQPEDIGLVWPATEPYVVSGIQSMGR